MVKIGVGSPTSTGGSVLEGNPGVIFDGLTASSVGHQASCPRCKKGVGPIMAVGPRTIVLPAGPAARSGDYVACGCPAGSNTLLPAGTVFIGSSSASSVMSVLGNTVGDPVANKSIDRIFWSYNESQDALSERSRFYVDLNLHAHTTGYQTGELIHIELQGPLETVITAKVQADGTVFIPQALKNHQLKLQGVL